MTAPARLVRFTRAEYAALERSSNVKHEFLEGVIYAMAGGSPEHAAISMNVGALLHVALRGKPCQVFSSDLRIRVLDTGLETYPDVSVVCGAAERHPEDDLAVTNPIVLVEVLSPSTEAYDRGEKLRHYRAIASLREVVLVDHRQKLVEVHRREDDGSWTRHEAAPAGAVHLVSLGCELSVDERYRDGFAEAGPRAPASR
ncbi:MAG: Uma2 family endonuclease [Myxococcales bacterium]|nr:Uma2 family endonuclease [Myxococcales bacterium]